MLLIRNIFKINFDESVKNLGFKDGIISIAYYLYEILITYLLALLMFKTDIYNNLTSYLNLNNKQFFRFIFYIPIMILQIAPIFILIKIRKQNIKSIGIKNDKILKSVFLGIIFSLPIIALPIIIAINQEKKVISLANLIWLFLYNLIEVAFVEELSFRGFIQTRIQGIIKIKWLSIIVVGVMFASMHIPFLMIWADMSLTELIINGSARLVITLVFHIYLVYLYTRHNNIISTIVTHTLINLIPAIFILN